MEERYRKENVRGVETVFCTLNSPVSSSSEHSSKTFRKVMYAEEIKIITKGRSKLEFCVQMHT